jgi:hypothetical protein
MSGERAADPYRGILVIAWSATLDGLGKAVW